MKNFLQRSSFLFLLLILSCSGSDENSGEDQANQYVDLFVSGTEGFIGETIIFSVFYQDGNNVSTTSDFYVNETKIPSNTCLLYTSPSPRD